MSWDGFNANIIANRQKDTFVHGFVDISGVFKTQSLLTSFDVPVLQQYAANTTVKSYTSNNPAYTGTYQIDGLTGQGNAIIAVSNVAGGVAFAGNTSIITSSNLLALGANIAVPKYANIAINANVPVGTNLTFNANIANVYYTAASSALSSNIVLSATTNANIGNITLFQTQDYLKANCSYKTSDTITIPLGMSLTGTLSLNTNLPGITNSPTNPVVYPAVKSQYTVLAFTSVGSYNLQFNNNTQIGYIVVGGGGAGGACISGTTAGGGGGGGGISYSTISTSTSTMTAGTNYTITVGSGGSGVLNSTGGAGGSSSIVGTGISIVANGGTGGTGGSSSAAGVGGSASGGINNITGGAGGAGGSGTAAGSVGSASATSSFSITDIASNAFQVGGGAGGAGSASPNGGATGGGGGGNGANGGGGGIGSGTSTTTGAYGTYSNFNSSGTGSTLVNNNTNATGISNTGGGGGGYYGSATSIGYSGGSGVVYIYFTTANSTPAVFSNITYRSAPANSTAITQTPVTIANVTVPPYYSGNALSIYVPIAANIMFAPSTNYNLNNGATGNTISFLTTINNVYANIYQNTTATSFANITLTPNMNSNIYITNTSTAPIYFGANITNSTAPTTLQLKQYVYTANITFTPAYSTLTNNYLVNMFSTGNILGSNATVGSALVNNGLFGNIEYNSITYSGNVNLTVAGSVSGNYKAANVTVGGNNNVGSIYSMGFGAYSGNVLFVNSYNLVKPNIQITYAPNIYLVNSTNKLQYSLVQGDYANNYIKTIQVPDLDTTLTSFNTSYTANIILGNINIPQNNSNIFANITTTDFHSLVTVGNMKVTVNNFPTGNTISNITTYANPPFNTSTGSGIFANSSTAGFSQQLNNLNFSGYNALSGNISLSKTFLNYSVTLANVTIMDQFYNNTTGNVTGSLTSGVSYTANGTSGQLTSPTISSTYSNIVPGQTYTIADFIGNVVLAGVYLPTTNSTTSTGIYTPYLSLVGNISAPYTTTIVNANVFSNIANPGFLGASNVYIIDNTVNNNNIGTTGATSSYVQGLPSLSGNVYANHMTTNNLTVAGQLNVRQYSAQNIIATTTTTYNQLTVNEDLTLNGKLITTGNVGIGSASPQYALDVLTTTGNAPLNVKVGTTNALVIGSTGKVAINSSSGYNWPLTILANTFETTGGNLICNSTALYGGLVDFQNRAPFTIWDNGYSAYGVGLKMGIWRDTGSAYIQCEGPNTGARNICLQPYTGNVGIGKTNPSVALDVNGAISINDPAYPTTTTISPNNSSATANVWATSSSSLNWVATNSSSYNSTYFSPYTAFLTNMSGNNNTANCGWMCSANSYTVNTGAYNTTTYSTIMQNGPGTVYGEWLQIQGFVPLVLRDFNLSTYFFNAGGTLTYTVSRLPYKFYICGSNDNSTWYPIIYVSNWSGLPTTTATGQVGEKTNTFTIPSGTTTGGTLTGSTVTGPSSARTITYSTYGNSNNAYTFFRLAVTGVNGIQNGASSGDGAGSVSPCGCLWSPTFINPQNSSISYSNGATIINSPSLIVNNGYVGIGLTNPSVPLHIATTGLPGTGASTNQYIGYASGVLQSVTANGFTNTSLFCLAGIMSNSYIASVSGIVFSDKRIKENITNMDSSIIQKFREIQPKVYQYIDKLQYGNDEHYGLIAQEIEEILPCAIQYHKLHIPNIYDMADISNNIIILKTKSTSKFEYDASGILFPKLKCYDLSNNEITVNITKIIDDKSFEIDITQGTSQIFVYGQEVNNYRGINYDTIFMLSFYVTQLLEKEYHNSKQEILDLQNENNELKSQMTSILSRLSALENK